MKTKKAMRFLALTILLTISASHIKAQEKGTGTGGEQDHIQISLLTCAPHDEVYSLYGHTAIRFTDRATGNDLAVNYGVFSFQKPFFVARFVFGLTDYEMGVEDFCDFCNEYKRYGAKVTEQVLNLTPEEKSAVAQALARNYMPENRVYRYNYFYNNCTTKARDIILSNINGKVEYRGKGSPGRSFRKIIHSCNETHRWARFGNDMLLGLKADAPATREEQQFLPANLMNDFANATICGKGGERPLVKETHTVVQPATTIDETADFFPTPTACAWIILALTAAVTAIQAHKKKAYSPLDTAMLATLGTAGLVLLAMIFSKHPTVSLNMQILLCNPLYIYAAWYATKNRKRNGRLKKMWQIITTLTIAALFCNLLQQFAEGITILALSLLTRGVYVTYTLRKQCEQTKTGKVQDYKE